MGKEAAAAAEQGVTAALGGSGGTGQQQISEALSKMTRPQIYEIMSQMKLLIQQNPAQVQSFPSPTGLKSVEHLSPGKSSVASV